MRSLKIFFIISLYIIQISCGNRKDVSLSAKNSEIVQKHLDEELMLPSFGGKVFSSFEVLKITGDEIFLWAYLQEYYQSDNKVELGSGWSVPVALLVDDTGESLVVWSHKIPGDGSKYSSDIKTIFPEDIQQEILDFPGSEKHSKLVAASGQRAERYFSDLSEVK